MVVISLEHAPASLKGWLCRYLYQIRPGLYVGTINAKIRNLLWKQIENALDCKDAVIIWSDANEQKFSFLMKGDPRRKLVDIEDIHWLYIEKEITHLSFKAKMNTNKTIICHLLETGITTKVLLEKGLLVPLVDKLAIYMKEDNETVIQFISFVTAIHDIGKIHPHFQWKIGNEIQGLTVHEQLPFRHEQYSEDIIIKLNDEVLSSIPGQVRENIGKIITLHHQGHAIDSFYVPTGEDLRVCNLVQHEVIEILYKAFPFKLSSSRWRYTNGVASMISAIVNLSDWIASTNGTFSENGYEDGEKYLQSLENQVYRFLENNFMLYKPNRFAKIENDADFFNSMKIADPRPMQKEIINLCKQNPKGGLMIIEAPCGEGKTAASLYAASHIQDTNGFYMALPTSATSESIHEEVDLICQQAKPLIKLPVFNGRAWMSNLSIDSDLWISPSRQKMLYPVAVGTVDQIIKASLMEKYGLLRLLALLGKVVIIDEMHAYDIYMQDMIEQFLAYCGMFHVPVVILSATLPSTTKEKLLSAYSGFAEKERQYTLNGKETEYDGKWQTQSSYPLITMVSNVDYGKTIEVTEKVFQASKQQAYRYEMVSVSEEYVREISDVCLGKIKNGGCLVVIVNLVDDAKELYRYLKEQVSSDTELYLLHGRNTEYNKEQASDKIKQLFGKDRSFRPKKSIVISTQILEQSMDIDFDFMLSMLAPIDLLLQRFGRYRRHGDQGTIREVIDEDKICIFIPEGKDTKRHVVVYGENIIRKTKDVLQQKSEKILCLPEETRVLIESVYDDVKQSTKEIKKEMKAQERIIPAPKNQEFLYYEESKHLQSALDTRYSDMRTYDVAILPEEIISRLKINPSSLDLIKEIKKNYTITGILENRLKKNGAWIFSKVDLPKSKMLNNILIFQEKNGVVKGSGCQMWIDEIYGLEFEKHC